MKKEAPIEKQLRLENEELRQQLYEAVETLDAIRNGKVDAIVVSGDDGDKIFSLGSAETPYRIIVEEMNEGSVSLSARGTILYCNRRFAELVSVPSEQIIGSDFARFVPEPELNKYEGLLKTSTESKSKEIFSFVDKNGKTLYFLVSLSPLPSNMLGDICLLISDITDLKKMEMALRESHEQLEHRVMERTTALAKTVEELAESRQNAMQMMNEAVAARNELEISNKNLFEQISERKLAEAEIKLKNEKLQMLNATKDKFFSIITHDLKSPFNSILGFSELLDEKVREKDYSAVGKYAGIILQSSQRAMDLLMNLMEWSRSQTGRMEFNPEYFEMVRLIHDVADLFEDIARHKTIIIQRELPSGNPVFADKAMISTIVRNLISNAIKFTQPGGQVEVSAHIKNDELTVSVADNGVGISKSNIARLFRIDENITTIGTRNEQGTGLGLILCKEFIQKHGGNIWVESEMGKGSVFSFSIPVKLS